jgi:hypothetical protein
MERINERDVFWLWMDAKKLTHHLLMYSDVILICRWKPRELTIPCRRLPFLEFENETLLATTTTTTK